MSVAFHRTANGLSNQAAFAKVDAIVFCEGGSSSLSMAEVEEGRGNNATSDATFWLTLFRQADPRRRVDVRSIGNKPTLEAIAALVSANTVHQVFVALDRDFDHLNGLLIRHRNVFYTFGYSWENDVFQKDVLMDVVGDLAASQTILQQARETIDAAAVNLERHYSWVVKLDRALAQNGSEIIRRSELESSVRLHDSDHPQIDRSVIAAELYRGRNRLSSPGQLLASSGSVESDLHGHTLSKWWLGVLQCVLRRHLKMKLANSVVTRLAIAAYGRSRIDPRYSFYRDAMSAADW